MKRRLAILAAVLAPEAAFAQVDVTSTTTVAWHGDNQDQSGQNDHYGEVFQRLNLRLSKAEWAVGGRLDTATFAGTSAAMQIEDRYTPEKLFLTYSGPKLRVELGDAYVSFGRGLSLSLRKLDEFGVDTTLRGARVVSQTGPVETTLVAGVANIVNVDEASGKSVDDPLDLIFGARTEVAIGTARLGAHGVAYAFEHDLLVGDPNNDYEDRTFMVGPTLHLPKLAENVSAYLEGVSQTRRTSGVGQDGQGFGLYGTLTVLGERASLLFEGKAYGNLQPVKPNLDPAFAAVTYNNPPTVERAMQIIAHEQRDIMGGRLQFDWRFTDSLSGFASYGYFQDKQPYASAQDPMVHKFAHVQDPYVGLEGEWNGGRSRVLSVGGYRTALSDDLELLSGDAHGQVIVTQSAGKDLSLELSGYHNERQKVLFGELMKYREGSVTAGVRLASALTAAAAYEFTTDPSQMKRDHVNGMLGWDITPGSSLRFFVGSQRGGIQCTSGVCRTVAPFEGIRMIATFRL